ncbi:HK97 family phage prohead protease [Sphingomonas sp. ERG5]|uniref:HK97 family phage prohead protease n=1 Tax=Sphingomonas sp. ERG5 TaxID=1381597 RepID=UPI00054B3038|nr:HK97 family phage prohead protease [Sphingomonas sp. ERG5]
MIITTKAISIEQIDEAGTGLARIAQLSAVDNDDDTYLPGAFSWKVGGYQWASILPAHDRRAMPFGKARVYEDGDYAFAELRLNLETQAGRDWHSALKFDLATGQPVQEWSYGFETIDADFQQRGNSRVRLLKRLDVHEVSPVLKGAGIHTGTVSIKSAALKEAHFAPLIASLDALAVAVSEDVSHLSATGLKQLGEIHAALGKGLAAADGGAGEKDRALVDTVLADFLRHQSRHNLRG